MTSNSNRDCEKHNVANEVDLTASAGDRITANARGLERHYDFKTKILECIEPDTPTATITPTASITSTVTATASLPDCDTVSYPYYNTPQVGGCSYCSTGTFVPGSATYQRTIAGDHFVRHKVSDYHTGPLYIDLNFCYNNYSQSAFTVTFYVNGVAEKTATFAGGYWYGACCNTCVVEILADFKLDANPRDIITATAAGYEYYFNFQTNIKECHRGESITHTSTPSASATPSYSQPLTSTFSYTPTPSVSATPTLSLPLTPTRSYTPTPSRSYTPTPSISETFTATESATATYTAVPTYSVTITPSYSQSLTPTPSISPTISFSSSLVRCRW